jgi:hypothetical protein
MIVPQRWAFRFSVKRIGDMLHDERTVVLEVCAQLSGQRIDGLVDDNFLSVAAPSARAAWTHCETHSDSEASAEALSQWIGEHASHLKHSKPD